MGIKARHLNRNAVLGEGFRKNSPSVGDGCPARCLEQCEVLVKARRGAGLHQLSVQNQITGVKSRYGIEAQNY